MTRTMVMAVGVAALACALFFTGLGSLPLFDVDEAVFAEATREMIQSGEWITPQYNGTDRFDKPILFYWLMASAFILFGVGEWSARFWSATWGVGLVVLIVVFGWRRVGPRAGLLAGLVAATSLEVIVLAHSAITDMTLILFLSGGLLAFYGAIQDRSGASNHRAVIGSALLGLAVLTKGPVGLLIPALIIAAFLALRGGFLDTIQRLPWRAMATVFALVVIPWYALELHARGWSFIDGFFLKHNVRRFTGVISGHAGSVYYYIPVVAIGFFPWTAFLVPAGRWAWPSGWRGLRNPTDREALGLFLLVWVGTVFVFFSLAGTKLPNYVASLYPPLALMVGVWADRWVGTERSDRWVAGGLTVLVVVSLGLAVALGGIPWWLDWARERFPGTPYLQQAIDVGAGPRWLAATCVVGALTIVGLAVMRRRAAAIGAVAMTTAVVTVVLLTHVAPVAASVMQTPLRDLSLRASRELTDDDVLAVYGLNKPSVAFYSRRLVTVVGESHFEEIAALFAQERRCYVITKAAWIDRWRDVPSFRVLEIRGGYLLASNEKEKGL